MEGRELRMLHRAEPSEGKMVGGPKSVKWRVRMCPTVPSRQGPGRPGEGQGSGRGGPRARGRGLSADAHAPGLAASGVRACVRVCV